MSRLDELRDELYRKKATEPPAPSREGLALPQPEDPVKPSWPDTLRPTLSLLAQTHGPKIHQRRGAWRILLAIGAILLLGVAALIGYTTFFSSRDVEFQILGPDQTTSGESTVITVRIVNRTAATLREGTVTLTFPEGTVLGGGSDSAGSLRHKLEVEDLPPDREFQQDISVRLLGTMEQIKTVSGTYVYRPENITSQLRRAAEFSTVIVRVPITVSVAAPERVSSGQELTLEIAVDSELSPPLPGMSLGIDFPQGFKLLEASPPPADASNRIWPLADLASGTSAKITLRGTITGSPREVKAFHFRLGRFDPRTKTWLLIAESSGGPEIASPFLFVLTTLGGSREGTLAPGAKVAGSVSYKNNLSQKIENVTIELFFPEKFVKLESIRAERGFYDVTRQALVWKSSSEPRLKEIGPGEEGTLAFSFEVKTAPPIKKFSDKNFVFPVVTTINTASLPPEFRGASLEYRDTIEFKIESRLNLAARAAYYDTPTANSGPLPPRVRRPTTYTLWFQLSNGANDLRDVGVKGTLGGGAEWKGALESSVGSVSFNPATQEVSWQIRELSAATGILRAPASAAIQVVFTPAENQINTSPELLRDISAIGRDAFTDKIESDSVENLTTELHDDPQSESSQWRVVP